jgi:colanic acid biosynthesis glycosyl transferase WcaI
VASTDVRAARRTDSVELRGLLSAEELRDELGRATLGVVSQRPDVAEFNLPSKLMNYMARGLPVLAAVRTDSEVAALLEESGAGWITDCADPREFAARAAEVVRDRSELARRGEAGLEYAREHFAPERSAELYERVLLEAVGLSATRRPARAPLTRGARRTV